MTFSTKCSHGIAPALIAALTVLAPLTARAYELKVPWRGDSLPQLSYMKTRGHINYNCLANGHGLCALDISGVRWDNATNAYSSYKEGATAPLGEYDKVDWGMPLYSPVEGEIIACFRNLPDDNDDGSEPIACPNLAGDGTDKCSDGGNHLVIRTFDNHTVTLAHLQQHSIPSDLCPITDSLLFDDQPKYCNLPDWHGVLVEGARLDHRGFAPIPVRKGDFVGRIGLSGRVTGTHLHMSAVEITMDPDGNTCGLSRPIEFVEAWSQDQTPGVAPTATNWDRLSGAVLPFNGTTYLLWPDPLGPKVDELGMEYGTAPALALSTTGGVAAYRNQAGNLAVNAMLFDASGNITLGTPEEEGAIGDVALSTLSDSSRHVIAAVQTGGTAKLKLIPYFVTTTAGLVRGVSRTESTTGIGQVEATEPPSHDGIVVAIQNGTNAMSVISYGATFTGTEEITVNRLASAASATAISDLGVATVTVGRGPNEWFDSWQGVVTVERRSSDNTLWVRSWQIDSTGSTVTLVDSEQARDINTDAAFTVSDVDVSVARTGSEGGVSLLSREVAVVSAATSSGLRVQTWQITSTGQLSAIDQWDAEGVAEVSSARVGASDTLIGARTSGGSLRMISFHVGPDGELGRAGTRTTAGSILGLEVDGVDSAQNAMVLALSPTSEVTLNHYFTNYSSLY
jgi:hypothetical protein